MASLIRDGFDFEEPPLCAGGLVAQSRLDVPHPLPEDLEVGTLFEPEGFGQPVADGHEAHATPDGNGQCVADLFADPDLEVLSAAPDLHLLGLAYEEADGDEDDGKEAEDDDDEVA